MDLLIRLNILKDSGVLSEENYKKILEVIKYFKEEKNIILTEENASMFITHLASALARIENNEEIENIDELIFKEISLDDKYHETVNIVGNIEKITGDFPENERNFIEMHICTLLKMQE